MQTEFILAIHLYKKVLYYKEKAKATYDLDRDYGCILFFLT